MNYLNEITVYIYYIKEKYEYMYGEVLPIFDNIFAYTENKEYSKIFEDQRDMKLFKKEKKEMSRDEYNSFIRYMMDNSDRHLENHEYTFYSSKTNESYETNIIVTSIEKKRIEGRLMQLELNISKYCWCTPYVFNDSIKKALEVLKYNDISRFIGLYPSIIYQSLKSDNTENPENYNSLEDIIKINELELVIDVIGRTLKV